VGSGLLIAQASGRAASRGQRVLGRFDALTVGCGLREVIRQRLYVRLRITARFERLTNLAVQTDPPRGAQLRVDRLAHQRMRKGIVAVPGLGQQPCGDGLLERVEHPRLRVQDALQQHEGEH
jgi:hypothetical protein